MVDNKSTISPKIDATPEPSVSSGENSWIMQSLNQVNSRLEGIENRLRRLEIRIAVALGFVLCFGIIIGLVARFVSFDFEIAIIPKNN